MKCKYCDETLGDEDSHGCMALERKETPTDKSPRDEFFEPCLVCTEAVCYEGHERPDRCAACGAIYEWAYLAVKQELDKRRMFDDPPDCKDPRYRIRESEYDTLVNERDKLQQELEAARAERDDARSVLAGVEEQAKKNSEYDDWRVSQLEKQLADVREELENAKAQIKDYESALEFECGNRCDAHYNPCNAREVLTKWKSK